MSSTNLITFVDLRLSLLRILQERKWCGYIKTNLNKKVNLYFDDCIKNDIIKERATYMLSSRNLKDNFKIYILISFIIYEDEDNDKHIGNSAVIQMGYTYDDAINIIDINNFDILQDIRLSNLKISETNGYTLDIYNLCRSHFWNIDLYDPKYLKIELKRIEEEGHLSVNNRVLSLNDWINSFKNMFDN